MAKHLNVAEESNNKSKIVLGIIIVLIVAFMFGWGENYIARQSYEASVETQAIRQDLADKTKETVDNYLAAIGEDYNFKVMSVSNDGITGKLSGWLDNGDHFVENVFVPWDEVEEFNAEGRAYTNAALYSE